MRTTRDPVFIDSIILIFKTCSCIEWNICFLEMPVLTKSITGKKALIKQSGIESGISEEGFRVDQWMPGKEVFECRDQKFGIMNTLILIRGVRFLFYNNIRMGRQEVVVVERDMADNDQPIGDNAKLEDVAKMSIDIQLLEFRIRRSMGRHGTVGGLIRVVGLIKAMCFRKGFQLTDDPIGIFGIVFGDKSFNTGRIKDGHICFCRVDCLTNRFGNVNKVIKYELQVI